MFGQFINKAKSELYSSPNTPHQLKRFTASTHRVKLVTKLGNYLGSPIISDKAKGNEFFQEIVDKIRQKLQS